MYCPSCGGPNEENTAYCVSCGASLRPGQAQEAAPAQEAGQGAIAAGPARQEVEPSAPESGALPARSPAPPTSGMAVASLALGIAGWTILPFLGSVLAIILGYMARSDIRRRPDQVSGEGIAQAGIVLGWIVVILTLLAALFAAPIALCAVCASFGW